MQKLGCSKDDMVLPKISRIFSIWKPDSNEELGSLSLLREIVEDRVDNNSGNNISGTIIIDVPVLFRYILRAHFDIHEAFSMLKSLLLDTMDILAIK